MTRDTANVSAKPQSTAAVEQAASEAASICLPIRPRRSWPTICCAVPKRSPRSCSATASTAARSTTSPVMPRSRLPHLQARRHDLRAQEQASCVGLSSRKANGERAHRREAMPADSACEHVRRHSTPLAGQATLEARRRTLTPRAARARRRCLRLNIMFLCAALALGHLPLDTARSGRRPMTTIGEQARFVATAAIRQAVVGRETDVLDALGIDWRAGRPHITCPYPDHGGADRSGAGTPQGPQRPGAPAPRATASSTF